MVGTTAFVASSRARSTSKSTTRSESTTESATRTTKTTASAWKRTRTSWAWARTLKSVSTYPTLYHSCRDIQPNDLVDRSYSIFRWFQHRSIEELDNRPERVLDPGSGSTAWPQLFLAMGIRSTHVLLSFRQRLSILTSDRVRLNLTRLLA